MKLTVQKSDLQRELEFARPGFATDRTNAAFETVRLATEGDTLTLKAANPRVALRTEIAASIDAAVPAVHFDVKGAPLLEIVRSLDKGNIHLTVDHGRLVVAQAAFEARFLPSLNFSGIPETQTDFDIALPASTMLSLLGAVTHAAAEEDFPHLKACALIEFRPDYLRAVATDGRRLTSATVSGNAPSRDLFIPTSSLDIVRSMLLSMGGDVVTLKAGASQLVLSSDTRSLITGVVLAKYPPYAAIMKRNGQDISFVVDRDTLITGVKRTLLASAKHHRSVALVLKGDKLAVEIDSAEDGMNASEWMPVQCDSAASTRFRVNALFLLDAIQAAPEGDLRFQFGNDKLPILITPIEQADAELVSVVMPLSEKK